MHVQSVQKYMFFIVKYANLWGFCCRRRRGCFKLPIETLSPLRISQKLLFVVKLDPSLLP